MFAPLVLGRLRRASIAGLAAGSLGVALAAVGLGLWGFVTAAAISAPFVAFVVDVRPPGHPLRRRRLQQRPIGRSGARGRLRAAMRVARRDRAASGGALAYVQGGNVEVTELTRECTRVGRNFNAHIRFEAPFVSGRHALFIKGEEGVRVLDDDSRYGVLVNGERIESRLLNDGDEIQLGNVLLIYLGAATMADDFARARAQAAEVLRDHDPHRSLMAGLQVDDEWSRAMLLALASPGVGFEEISPYRMSHSGWRRLARTILRRLGDGNWSAGSTLGEHDEQRRHQRA
jgi:hypothetical protein